MRPGVVDPKAQCDGQRAAKEGIIVRIHTGL